MIKRRDARDTKTKFLCFNELLRSWPLFELPLPLLFLRLCKCHFKALNLVPDCIQEGRLAQKDLFLEMNIILLCIFHIYFFQTSISFPFVSI